MAAADVARRLLAKHGRTDGVLRRPRLDNTAPPNKPWAPVDADPAVDPVVASNLSVVVLDASVVAKPGAEFAPETTSVAYLDADVEPLVRDLLETRGETYSVLRVEELAPGLTTAMFTLHLKAS